MLMNIRIMGAAAAALAVSAVPVSAQQFSQQPPLARSDELDGAPRLFSDRDRDSNRDYDRDDRDGGRDRGRPDYDRAQRNCSREANRDAWSRDYYSAQYDREPRLERDRDGWKLLGRMRLQDRRGYSYLNTACDLRRNGDVEDFDFLR